jgi:hypothetical protein
MHDPMRNLRRLVWLYFWLLLFEGALRKWIVPGLSSALLIVRDPVALAIYVGAFQQRVFPRSAFVFCTALLALLCAAASMAGIGTLPVTLYGLRADFLHLPLIVVLPCILRPEDVRRMGYALLALLPAMAVLAVLQFKGGPDSRWNVGAGGQVGGQLYAAAGKVRVSGTFSFITGMASYLALCSAFLLADLLRRRSYPRWMQWASGPALLFTLGISGSRAAVVSVAVVCATVCFIVWRTPAHFGALMRPILLGVIAFVGLVAFTTSFSEGVALQQERFSGSGGVKKGIVLRYLETFNGGWQALFYSPPLGFGLGVGTNAGAGLLMGKREFSLGEGEWQRVILESGPILGPAYLALRASALLMIIAGAIRGYRAGRILPLLLVGAGGLDLLTGQFGQPTTLGFAVLTTGLSLSAAGLQETTEPIPKPVIQAAEARVAGRSRYAERLHRDSGAREP